MSAVSIVYIVFLYSSIPSRLVTDFGPFLQNPLHRTARINPLACPIYAPTTIVIGHFFNQKCKLILDKTCQSRSQSRGMGTAPNQAPKTVPSPPQYVHFRTSTSVEYSKVINCRTVSSEGGRDDERGYVERRAMWAAARKV